MISFFFVKLLHWLLSMNYESVYKAFKAGIKCVDIQQKFASSITVKNTFFFKIYLPFPFPSFLCVLAIFIYICMCMFVVFYRYLYNIGRKYMLPNDTIQNNTITLLKHSMPSWSPFIATTELAKYSAITRLHLFVCLNISTAS